MPSDVRNTLPKTERLCGKANVSALIGEGKWGSTAHIRYCWTSGGEDRPNRIMVSVSKKFFKRAVRRNLLKRRMREAYRTRKDLLPLSGVDCLFAYSSKEIIDFGDICSEIETILTRIGKNVRP